MAIGLDSGCPNNTKFRQYGLVNVARDVHVLVPLQLSRRAGGVLRRKAERPDEVPLGCTDVLRPNWVCVAGRLVRQERLHHGAVRE